jgi:hypothetical protein
MAFIDVSPSALRLSDESRSDLLVRHHFLPTLLSTALALSIVYSAKGA